MTTRGTSPFGRIGKLLRVFGFMDQIPTTVRTGMTGGPSYSPLTNTYYWYQNQIQISQERDQAMKDYADMEQNDLVNSALEIYAEEVVATDINYPNSLWVESSDSNIQFILTNLLEQLNVEEYVFSQAWNLAAYGNDFEKLESADGIGLVSQNFVPPDQVKRYWDETKNLIGFEWQGFKPPRDHAILDEKGLATSLWLPWDFVHFRRLGRNRGTEYGESIIDGSRQIFKKLKMVEDAMITNRLDIMPSRYKCLIDTGNSDIVTATKQMNEWRRYLRSQIVIDPSAGTYEKRFSPWALDDIIFFPVKKDSRSTIEKIPGDSDIPDTGDVEFLTRKLIARLRIPPAFLGFEGEINSKATLIQESIRFARAIKALRKPLICGYQRICEIHLAMMDIDPDSVDFQILMPPISAIDEQMKSELVSTQLDIMDKLGDIRDKYGLDPREWAHYVFREYMHLPIDIVDRLLLSINVEQKESVSTTCTSVKSVKGSLNEDIREFILKDRSLRMKIDAMRNILSGRVGFPLTVARSEPLPCISEKRKTLNEKNGREEI